MPIYHAIQSINSLQFLNQSLILSETKVFKCFFLFRYVTIQRGNRPSSPREEPKRGNSKQVGRDLITRFGSAQNALRIRLRQPRDRVAAPSLREGNRRRRSPESVSIVYPSPPLNSLSISEEESFLPILPQKTEVNYIYANGDPLIREKKQTPPPESPLETTLSPNIETESVDVDDNVDDQKEEEDEEEYDYSDWDTNVSVSKTVSQSFSISKMLNNIIEVVSSTLAPILSTEAENIDDDQRSDTTTENSETTATTIGTTSSDKPKDNHNKLFSLFKPSSRVHPFLASKSTTTTEPTTTTTRKSFLKSKKSPLKSTPELEKKDNAKDGSQNEKDIDMKLMKMMNILNTRDMKEEMKEEKIIQEEGEEEASTESGIENEIEEVVEAAHKESNTLLHNRNERPKFQVPKSLKDRLQKQTVEDSGKLPKDETQKKVEINKPVNLFRKPSSPVRPLKPRPPSITIKPPITSRPIELPKSRSSIVTKPNRPLDLDVSPSRTITRAKTTLRRPSLSSVTKVEVTTSTSTTEATTEKLTVGDILAGLHGEVQQEPKTFTRTHSFKPKSDTSKLREKLRLQLEVEKSDEPIDENILVEAISEDINEENNLNLLSVSRPVVPSRRVIPSRSKISRIPESHSKLRTRKPTLRENTQSEVKNVEEQSNQEDSVKERVISGDDLLASLGLIAKDDTTEEPLKVKPTVGSIGLLESLFSDDDKKEIVEIVQEKPSTGMKDLLNLAVVEKMTLPPETTQPKGGFNEPLRQSQNFGQSLKTRSRSRSRSRSRVPEITSHRFKPSTVQTTTDATTRSNFINNRRLRIRQRGRVSLQNVAPGEENDNENIPESSTEAVIPSTKSSSSSTTSTSTSRLRVRQRQPIRRTRPVVKDTSTPSTERTITTIGSRTSNLKTSPRTNSRLRVRTRGRTPIKSIENSSEEETESTDEELSELQESTSNQNIGKSDESKVESNTSNNPEEESDNEESVTLRSGTFKPRFGNKQRNAVRTRLKQQLFETTEEEIAEEPAEKEDDDVSVTTANPITEAFETSLSSIFGLSAVPASFFTTTSRFVAGVVTTPAPESSNDAFLPTLSPLQRVGRSTVGYGPVPTKKPDRKPIKPIKFLAPKSLKVAETRRGSRPKFGQKFSTTASSIEEDEDNFTTLGISSTQPPTVATSTEEGTAVNTEGSTVTVKSDNKSAFGKKGLFTRPRVDFLKKFEKKIAEIERKEEALKNSFGGPKVSTGGVKQQKKESKSKIKKISGGIELKRPRRKLGGLNDFNELKEVETTTQVNDVIEENYIITFNNSEPNNKSKTNAKEGISDSTTKNFKKAKPTLPKGLPKGPPKSFLKGLGLPPQPKGLPKGFPFPFSKNRFGKHQPKLLSFQIIKSKPEKKTTTTESPSADGKELENDVTDKTKDSNTKKLSFRDKLKYGRKSFGNLIKQPKPFFPTPAPKTTTSPTTPEVPHSETTQDSQVVLPSF